MAKTKTTKSNDLKSEVREELQQIKSRLSDLLKSSEAQLSDQATVTLQTASRTKDGELHFYSNPKIPDLKSQSAESASSKSVIGPQALICSSGEIFATPLRNLSMTGLKTVSYLPGRFVGKRLEIALIFTLQNQKKTILLIGKTVASEKMARTVVFSKLQKTQSRILEKYLRSISE